MLIKRGLFASSIKLNFEMVRAVFNVTVKEAGLELVNPFSQVILSGAKQGRVRPAIPIDIEWFKIMRRLQKSVKGSVCCC